MPGQRSAPPHRQAAPPPKKKRDEDETDKAMIDKLRDLHRNLFMRHVHQEMAKIWEKKDP